MHKKKVILSFDYELFFGDRSGTVQKTLIEPTNQLLDAMDRAGLKGNFFVDWLMLKYLALEKDQRAQHDYNYIVSQLKDIVLRGHRIELHIHPHWVDAKYNNGIWDFSDYKHYRLCSFGVEDITKMFVEGTEYLERIVREVDPKYKVVAFRAGGWAVLPFNIMSRGFEKAGLKVDSSVMRGCRIETPDYTLDFTNTPEDDIYCFSDDVMKQDEKGKFVEVPISTFNFTVRRYLQTVFYFKAHKGITKHLADGTHNRSGDFSMPVKKMSRWQLMHRQRPYSLDGVTCSKVLNNAIKQDKHNLIVFISHPKDFQPITTANIRGMREKFKFCTYNDLLSNGE